MAQAECSARLGEFLLFCLNEFAGILPYIVAVIGLIILVMIVHALIAEKNKDKNVSGTGGSKK